MIKYLSLILFFITSMPALAVPSYIFTPLDDLSGVNISSATDINDLRQVVGFSEVGNFTTRAFLWQSGVMTDIGTLTGDHSAIATSINGKGQITGTSFDEMGLSRVFLYTDGEMVDLGGLPNSFRSVGLSINDAGQIVGQSETSLGNFAFLYDNGEMTSLRGPLGGFFSSANDINESGQIVGVHFNGDTNCICAFIYNDGVVTDIATFGASATAAYGINDLGQVVGEMSISGETHAFLWQSGTIIDLGLLPGFEFASAFDINEQGQIVGSSFDFEQNMSRAFLFDNGSMFDLNDLTSNLGDWILIDAAALNNHGDIVGRAFNPVSGVTNAFLLTPIATDVPEPAALTLLGSGVAGIFAIRRRRIA